MARTAGRTEREIRDIVLADGHVERVMETLTAGRTHAPPEPLSLIRRAAAAHSIPAVLTGAEVRAGLPADDVGRGGPGLYYDPAGEPGLRRQLSAYRQVFALD